LVRDQSRKHPDAWRLPADQIEARLADLVREHLARADMAPSVISGLLASEAADLANRLKRNRTQDDVLALIERCDIQPGASTVQLNRSGLAVMLGIHEDRVNPGALKLKVPFQMRRRGVETKIVLGAPKSEVDRTLVQNIVKAGRWMQMLLEGQSLNADAA
jgi:hypothetical protein